MTPKQRNVRFLWLVLEGLTKEQRRIFLKFMWGRTRLPLTEQDWGEQKMRIHTLDTHSPDTHFPVAHTCFFSIEWPQYSTLKIAREKLLYAINNCNAIDADNTRGARQREIKLMKRPRRSTRISALTNTTPARNRQQRVGRMQAPTPSPESGAAWRHGRLSMLTSRSGRV